MQIIRPVGTRHRVGGQQRAAGVGCNVGGWWFAKVAAAGQRECPDGDQDHSWSERSAELARSEVLWSCPCLQALPFLRRSQRHGWAGGYCATRPPSVAGPFQNQQQQLLGIPSHHFRRPTALLTCRVGGPSLRRAPRISPSSHGGKTMSVILFDRTPRRCASRSHRRRRACNELIVPITRGRPAGAR